MLRGAVFQGNAPSPGDPALLVDVIRSGDAWHRVWGSVADEASAAKLLGYHAGHSHWNWIYCFLHYPLDMKPKPPRGILPLTWEAPDFGYFGFRNQWDGKDDFLAQVFLKSHLIGGWNGPNGGTFRLLGLGHVWAYGPTDRNRSRWEENVVQLPDNPEINLGALGRLTHIETRNDGSGVASMNLGDIYATAAVDRKGRKPRLYEAYGNIRVDKSFAESGIAGIRSVGVDYSGKCGAPCLFVVVDKIAGGKRKIWTWQVDKAGGRGDDLYPPYKRRSQPCFSDGAGPPHTASTSASVARAGSEDP